MRNILYIRGFQILLLSVFTLWSGISLAGEYGINDSKHDLSYLTATSAFQYLTNQTCVFCHTPHGANDTEAISGGYWTSGGYTGSGSPILLWNRSFANVTSASYLLYGSSTLDANGGTLDQVRVYSLLCLSCHDGVSALNVVNNLPGDTTAKFGQLGFIPPKDGGTPTTIVDGGFNGGGSGWGPNIGARLTTNDDVNLRGDHPISFDYTTGLGVGLNSPALVIQNTNLKLFPNPSGTLNVSLECSTCHDVHNEGDPQPYDGNNPNGQTYPFLRMTLDQSRMCTACHLK